MVDMSCLLYVLEALGQSGSRAAGAANRFSRARKLSAPNATVDASGSKIELSSALAFIDHVVQACHHGHSGSNHEAQRQRIGTTTLHPFNPRASLMAGRSP